MSTNCNNKWTRKQLYKHMKKIKRSIEENYSPTYLSQSDFDNGTFIIDKPGNYILTEDITFNPNPDNDWMPKSDQIQYSDHAFVLGFFACIMVKTYKFIINLNGKTIKQSPEHALQQRFYSNIELGSSPFLPGQGPANFASSFTPARDGIICNGTLGRSSHHGIHGNNAVGILVEKLIIKDFEFVGSALNGGGCHIFSKINVKESFQNIPVLATYSAGRFIRLFAKHLLTKNSISSDQKNELQQKLDHLELSLDDTFKQIMETGSTNNKLFRNESRLADGNVYGILFHTTGVAVNNFVEPIMSSNKYHNNVFLYKVCVKKLKGKVDEIISISNVDGTGVQVDTSGAVLQIDNITNSDGTYNGNVLSDLQIYLGKLKLELNIPLGTLNISEDIVIWSENGSSINELLEDGYVYRTGADSMFHVNKGIIGYRFGGIRWLEMKKCYLYDIENQGFLGNETITPYLKAQNNKYYIGAETFGISLSACKFVNIEQNKLKKIISKNGNAIGITAFNKTENAKLFCIKIKNIKAGICSNKRWIGINYYGKERSLKCLKRNEVPQAIGINICKDCCVKLENINIKDLCSPKKPKKIIKC